MKNTDPFRQRRILNNNHKNFHRSSSMQYIPKYMKSLKDNITDNIGFNKRNTRNKIKKSKENQNINLYYLKKRNTPFIKSNQNTRLNSCQNNIIYPKITLNKNRNVKNDNNNINNFNNTKRIYNNFRSKKTFKDATTHYSISNNHDSNFLLNQKIKIIKDSNLNTNTYNSQFIDDKTYVENSNLKTSSAKKIIFNKLIPNDLRIFKKKLFQESSKEKLNKSNNQEELTLEEGKRIISNSEINSSIRNSKISNISRKSVDEKGYQNLDFNGVITKVITRLSEDEDLNKKNNDKKNIDYHKIMKHPFIVESFGYDFLKNKKNKYKIYENPFDDKNLANYIHNLIINPNTKKFRNDSLISGHEIHRRKSSSENIKNYKLLSKIGLQRMQSDVIKNIRKNVKASLSKMNRIQSDLDILIQNNIKRLKEHKDELINEDM